MTNNEDFEPYKMPYAETGLPLSPCMMREARKWKNARLRYASLAIIFGILSVAQYYYLELLFLILVTYLGIDNYYLLLRTIKLVTGPIIAVAIIYSYTFPLLKIAEVAESKIKSAEILPLLISDLKPFDHPYIRNTGEFAFSRRLLDIDKSFGHRLEWIYEIVIPRLLDVSETNDVEVKANFTSADIATANAQRENVFGIFGYVVMTLFGYVVMKFFGFIVSILLFGHIAELLLVSLYLNTRKHVASLAYRAALIKIFSGYWPWEYK